MAEATSIPGDWGIPDSANRRFREKQAELKGLKKKSKQTSGSQTGEGSKKPGCLGRLIPKRFRRG